jgi:hypothetical protein
MSGGDISPEPGGALEWEGEYEKEVTEESFKELSRLVGWTSSLGSDLYLIGGWASYHYHRGLGSRDIDVIFADRGVFGRFLTEYYRANGYTPSGGVWERKFRKMLSAGGRSVRIEVDAAHLDDSPPFKEDRDRALPFRLLTDYHATWKVGPLEVLIPQPELLVLMKAKTWRDRRWDIDHAAVAPLDLATVQGKIRKDEYDLRNLVPRVTSWDTLWGIADQCKCRRLIAETFHSLGIETPE